ncbi:MAG: serine/threonine protein kinase [Gemmataceae bacterium]
MRFTYRSGQRPLDGYTLKRGVGQGGFGEVYFAVSDGGKEVALKLLRGPTDVEMRGVAHCLNLKHPNLVHIYDLKSDDRGEKWLIMEYVLGENLGQVIDRHPNGLPVNLTAEWFQYLSRAVNYLHEHGVVHRDLKPANIFVETGNLKVGDYGLCKSINTSGRAQTQTVGTVHYMAPEISTGNYTRSIDIYACGVILHEMLTGKLPFDGETDGEILMKHLTATPTLDGVPNTFKDIVKKALEKNPLDRYASLSEMARAVELAYPTQGMAVAPPVAKLAGNPAVAAPAMAPVVPVPVPEVSIRPLVAQPLPVAPVVPSTPVAAMKQPILAMARRVSIPLRGQLLDTTGAMVRAPLFAAAGTAILGVLTTTSDWVDLGTIFLTILGVSWTALVASTGARTRTADKWGRRFRQAALGVGIGVLVHWLHGGGTPEFAPTITSETNTSELFFFNLVKMNPDQAMNLGQFSLYFALLMGTLSWWSYSAQDRKNRFGIGPLFEAWIIALVLGFLWPHSTGSFSATTLAVALAAATVQLSSPWLAPPPPPSKKLRWKEA